MRRLLMVLLLLLVGGLGIFPTQASDRISYTSYPEEVAVFLNNIAFARDHLSIPPDSQTQIILPASAYPNTLVLQENGQRVPRYRLSNNEYGQIVVHLDATQGTANRELTLDYLLAGLGWTPTYDMWIRDESEAVRLDFSAQIANNALDLEDTEVRLVAGEVAASGQIDANSTLTANQIIVGYDRSGNTGLSTGGVTIQHVYPVGVITSKVGETAFLNLLSRDFPARRVIVWNAATDIQATVIYKVRNDSELPLAEGIVHTYKDDLFTGSDPVETTPLGGEGSITVGGLQDVRVNRKQSSTLIAQRAFDSDTLYEVELNMTNFSQDPIEIEVVDSWRTDATDFVFSDEPSREPGNMLRWTVRLEPGETKIIEYEYKLDY